MITSLEIENLRIFHSNKWSFELPNIAIFCGTNSAGKSTILKSLLLLKQSQGIQEGNEVRNGQLRFNGSQVDLGSYYSLVSHNEIERDISICITVRDIIRKQYFLDLDSPQRAYLEKVSENSVEYDIKARFTFGSNYEPSDSQEIEEESGSVQYVHDTPHKGAVLKHAAFEVLLLGKSELSWDVIPTISHNPNGDQSIGYKLILPKSYFNRITNKEIFNTKNLSRGKFTRLETTLRGLLPDHVSLPLKHPKNTNRKSKMPPPPHVEVALNAINNAFKELHYLAPLRSPAKRFYMTDFDGVPGLDSEGQFLPYILRDRGEMEILNVHPGDGTEVHKESLSVALNSWLHYLRTGVYPEDKRASELKISDTKGVLVEFKIKTPSGSELHSVVDSGFGYSQVLPIIVRCLMAKRGSTLLIEQPELHLNPALQVRLAEFFKCCAISGKQVIIETHSEHIVNAVRVFSAEDATGQVASMSNIYFLEYSDSTPIVHDLSINQDGTMTDWPENFFGEALSLSSRLLKAQRLHRKKQPV